jgi:GNAT superfamily N-acetyltransferase
MQQSRHNIAALQHDQIGTGRCHCGCKDFTTMTTRTNETAAGPAIRRLWPGDIEAFREHLLRLDEESRAMRFGAAVSDDFVTQYAASIARFDGVVFGAFVAGRLIGVGELRLLYEDSGAEAEAAFSVERLYQDHGIGDALFSRLIAAARNRGITTLHMMCLTGNARMRHLAHKHAAEMEFADSEVHGTLRQAWPNFASLTEEMVGEAFGLTRALLRL